MPAMERFRLQLARLSLGVSLLSGCATAYTVDPCRSACQAAHDDCVVNARSSDHLRACDGHTTACVARCP